MIVDKKDYHFYIRSATTRRVSNELLEGGHVKRRHRRRCRCRYRRHRQKPLRDFSSRNKLHRRASKFRNSNRFRGHVGATLVSSRANDGKSNRNRYFHVCDVQTSENELAEIILIFYYYRWKCSKTFAWKYRPPPPSLHATPFSTRLVQNQSSNRGTATTPCAEKNVLITISHHRFNGVIRTHSFACTLQGSDRFVVAYLWETKFRTCPPPPNGT